MNEFPKVKDRSESFYRRLLLVPMEKRFEGHERKYIKNDYLYRDDVLQYVLYKVLYTTNYYELSEPKVCRELLGGFKEYNDTTLQFMKEVLFDVSWKLLPKQFVYDLYVAWFRRNNVNGKALGKKNFCHEFEAKLSLITYDGMQLWQCSENQMTATEELMGFAEPLILEYNLESWMNLRYGRNTEQCAMPSVIGNRYRGYLRNPNAPATCGNGDAAIANIKHDHVEGPLIFNPAEQMESKDTKAEQ